MQKIKSPNDINITIEPSSINRDAFYTIGFIFEDDGLNTPDFKVVNNTDDLIESNFMFVSKVFNFCNNVWKQTKDIPIVLIKKNKDESYEDCYFRNDTSSFYFITIESKDINTILEFNDSIKNEMKLQFFSTTLNVSSLVKNRKLVYFYQKTFDNFLLLDSDSNILTDTESMIVLSNGVYNYSSGVSDYFTTDDNDYPTFDNNQRLLLEFQDITIDESNEMINLYPEGGWIARCCTQFPSKIQWLYKSINADVNNVKEIPLLSNSYVHMNGNDVTVGTGASCRGYYIEHEVSLDWVKYAIQNNVWKLLYTSERKINSTNSDLQLIENLVKDVLKFSTTVDLFSSFKITESKIDRQNNSCSVKFNAELTYSILGASIDGTVFH